MIKNYIKIALRNYRTYKFYTIINVLGLSIGITCVMLIFLFVSDEMSYDTFHTDHEQIQFLGVERSFGGEFRKSRISAFPLGRTAVEELSGAESFVTATPANPGRVSVDGVNFTPENKLIAATSGFFTMFNFPLVTGNPETVLQEPGTVVITESMAEKYFPTGNALNQTLTIDRYGVEEYKVVGIAEDMTRNSYLSFSTVFSIEGLSSTQSNRDSWGSSMYNTFVRFDKNANMLEQEVAMNTAFDVQIGERRAANTNFFFTPLADLYLSDLIEAEGFKGSYTYIYIFSAIAIFVLLLASINYMNLSTARGMQRGREVGVRKVLGANKNQLLQQFLSESVLLSLFSLAIAFLAAELLLPYFNTFFDKSLSLNVSESLGFIALLVLATLVFGLLSGMYPALFLSRFKPSLILKSQSMARVGGVNLRKALVVFQFGISTVLVVGTIVVLNQLNYLLEKDLGFNKEQTVYIPFDSVNEMNAFKEKVSNYQGITSVAHADGVPGEIVFSRSAEYDPERPEEDIAAHIISVDGYYDETLGLEILAGSFFEEERATAQIDHVVINEAFMKRMNWASPEEAIDKVLGTDQTVLGVVKDFHFRSLRTAITPVIIGSQHAPETTFSGNDMLVIQFQDIEEADLIAFLRASWSEIVSGTPMTYTFIDEKMDQLYRTDEKLGQAFSFFAAIGIFIACLGLLGLTSFSAQLRIKEIGIRKVLGATVSSIVGLLSKEFVQLVVLGFLIAIPASWYLMNTWLGDFAYKIEIGPGIFIVAGLVSVTIAILTTGWQSIKAALANPADSLRSE